MTKKTNLLGLSKSGLYQLLSKNMLFKPFHFKQIERWIYKNGTNDFMEMTNLPLSLREWLKNNCLIQASNLKNELISVDGTYKWLFDVGENNAIETVYIPEKRRGTVCLSTQVGCAIGCPFCKTGQQGFNKNLNYLEIISQFWYAKKKIDLTNTFNNGNYKKNSLVTNVVMMGMGEPLLNYNNLVHVLNILLDENTYGLSKKRVTVSTSGIVPMIDRLSLDCPVNLAVSLHAANNILRDKLVPVNKKYPLNELREVCMRYLKKAHKSFITLEYIMLHNINDTDSDLNDLIKFMKNQINFKVNLIPFNSFKNSYFRSSTEERIQFFKQKLITAGFVTTVRKTRGADVSAACGQLAGEVLDRTSIIQRHKKIIPLHSVLEDPTRETTKNSV